ncbi:MAG: hypothetical protein HY868_16930 [Chloroflexi bacterium]|nr:hypothetical protein [Chloroflexota bacterium]
MRLANSKLIFVLGLLGVWLSACSSNVPTVTPTRAATQTPWIIYVPITVTPEPIIATPLPTVAAIVAPTARPTATRAPVVAKPAATKPPAAPPAPVAIAPTATPAPKCSYGPVTLKEPEDNALRRTKSSSVGGDTFRFIWDPPPELAGEVSSNVGYKLVVNSRRGGFTNGATLYLSHNKFVREGKLYIMDKPAVSALASGDSVEVTWNVTVIQAGGAISEGDPNQVPPNVALCGAPSPTRTIHLNTFE